MAGHDKAAGTEDWMASIAADFERLARDLEAIGVPIAGKRKGTADARLDLLSRRERQVALLLRRGKRPSEIAEQLRISPHTARNHVRAVFTKLGVRSHVELLVALHEPVGEEPPLVCPCQKNDQLVPFSATPRAPNRLNGHRPENVFPLLAVSLVGPRRELNVRETEAAKRAGAAHREQLHCAQDHTNGMRAKGPGRARLARLLRGCSRSILDPAGGLLRRERRAQGTLRTDRADASLRRVLRARRQGEHLSVARVRHPSDVAIRAGADDGSSPRDPVGLATGCVPGTRGLRRCDRMCPPRRRLSSALGADLGHQRGRPQDSIRIRGCGEAVRRSSSRHRRSVEGTRPTESDGCRPTCGREFLRDLLSERGRRNAAASPRFDPIARRRGRA